jgi:predicted DNA-binding transcriptional regulator AlpA
MRRRSISPAPEASQSDDMILLTAEQAAQLLAITEQSLYRGIRAGRLPKALYPMPRTPRWRKSELIEALDRTRASPDAAVAQRLAAGRAKSRAARRAAGTET